MGRSASPPTLQNDARRLLELLHATVSSAFRPILWKRALELELTYAQAQVLFYVHRHVGCPSSEVARAYAVTLPAVSQIVDRLADKRLLTRHQDLTDRRVTRLRLSREGDALARELEAIQVAGLAAALGRLSPGARRKLIMGLDALAAVAVREA